MTIASIGTGRLFSARCCGAARLAAVATSVLMLAGCGGPDLAPQPQTARPTESTQTDFGDLEVHFNAVRTDLLTPDVARAYGIERSANRVLLNVAMLQKTPGGAAVPVDGAVTVQAHNLNAQLKDLQMRRVQEGAAVYFIGEVGISGDEILVFNITVEPATGGGRHQAQFKREFSRD
jgi:outer membrane murein-binding lipoprotein Lpp